jgi:two-component system response regulator GlrR
MHDLSRPERLLKLVKSLEAEGYRCIVSEGFADLRASLSDPATKLLLLGVTESSLSDLIKEIRADGGGLHGIPVAVYLKQHEPGVEKDLLLPEIDDFLLEYLDPAVLLLRIRRLAQRRRLKQEEIELSRMNLMSQLGMQQLIGTAPSFLAAIEKIPRVAGCDAPVLITGDTGTGKEMCARAIHYLSHRASKPFIPINCGSIPADLFENEMFGHEPGAFTDARRSRKGLIAEAEGGTLFLDEVDSLPLAAQVKLLRFLQDRQYKPLGASHYRQADTRLLAASNQHLMDKVREGSFREDLYYRIKVVLLTLPALRERQEDVLPLALHFLKVSAQEYRRPVTRFSPDAVQKLLLYPWPGNVRELENVVRQAVVLANGQTIRRCDIQLPSDAPSPAFALKEPLKVAKARVIEAFERDYLKEMLAACGGNISKAARLAQKDRRSFFELLKKYDLTSKYQNSSGVPELEELYSVCAEGH